MALINSPEFNAAVGARIRAARIYAKLSQGALGEAIGVSFQQVQKYELGRDRVSAEALARIADATGRPVVDLLPARDDAGDVGAVVVPLSSAAIRRRLAVAERIEALTPEGRRQVIALLALLPRAAAGASDEPAAQAVPEAVPEAA